MVNQTITQLPTPPSTTDVVNFNDRADNFLAAIPTFVTQANTVIEQINSTETNINSKESSATSAASTAITQAGMATTKASEASTSATAAYNAQLAAEAVFDNFDDKYLGAKATAPTVDNDGNPLVTGALFFKTTSPKGIYVYDAELAIWSSPTYVPTSHGSLSGRSGADSHPMSAITGLDDLLSQKADKATTIAGYGITNAYTKTEVDTLFDNLNLIEKNSTPVLGLMWNQTDDMYKRIAKNVNYASIDGTGEFTSWKSPTAERQNDSDTINGSPLTTWLDTSTNLPFSSMKRYVIDNTGAEVKAYNADSFTHADQTSITSNQQIMVKIPQFHYIQAKIVDGGKTYHIYAVAKSSFTLDALSDLGFMAPVVTVWNPTAGVSSGTLSVSTLTSALHPAFTTHSGETLAQRYYGAFNAVSGRSICGSGVKATGSTRATARTQAQGFGGGFSLIDFFLESAKNILALVEHGTWYFDVGKWRGYDWNTSASANNQDNGLTLPLLDKTGVILDASNRVIANSYRGIESYHSHLWRFVDGVNSNNYSIYLAKPKATFTDDIIVAPYFDSGIDVVSGASTSYVADHAAGAFIPAVLGGSASTKTCDGAWSASGNTTLIVGGTLNDGATSGLSAWNSGSASSTAYWSIVSRPGL